MFDINRFPKRMSVSFTEEVGAELEAIAKEVNVPVAQIVRLCVDRGLPSIRKAAAERSRGPTPTTTPTDADAQ